MYYIVFAIWYLLSLLPMRIHYVFSDVLYLLVYRVVGYRKKVVWKNLSTSFPDKSEAELKKIEKGFYHWFCDYIVETIKMFSISEKEIQRRMKFEGMEQIDEIVKQGSGVTVYLGHYCNWEWITSVSLHLPHGMIAAQLYHPLENKVLDRLFYYSRGRLGAISLEMKEAFGTLRTWQKEGKHAFTGFIADQSPGFSSMHHWPKFLNHDTPAYTGGERIARILDTSVVYLDISRPKRGYYVAKVVKISDYPNEEPRFSITEKYYQLLENSIHRNPEYWLWSHNRWKRTWDDFVKCYPDEKDRQRILNKL